MQLIKVNKINAYSCNYWIKIKGKLNFETQQLYICEQTFRHKNINKINV